MTLSGTDLHYANTVASSWSRHRGWLLKRLMGVVSGHAVDVCVRSRASYFHGDLLCFQRVLLAPYPLNDTPLLLINHLSLLALASAAAQ